MRQSLFALLLMLFVSTGVSQSKSTQLSGKISDPAGYLVPGANITIAREGSRSAAAHSSQSAVADSSGNFRIPDVAPGSYTLTVQATGFASYRREHLTVRLESNQNLNIKLTIAEGREDVEVSSDEHSLTDPENNATGITLKNRDIELLPEESSMMLQQLQGLAGGSNAKLYVDGYSNGTMPPKDMIREIRINQNAYSAQHDSDPYDGQIEVFTKPGGGAVHASLNMYGNASGLNTNNPFIQQQPSYYFYYWYGDISGPLSRKVTYFLNGGQNISSTNSIIAAVTLDPNLNQTAVNQALPSTSTEFHVSPRLDFQPAKSSTVSVRYQVNQNTQKNQGVGGLTLASQAYNGSSLNQTLQVSNAQAIGAKIVNDTRFQFSRADSSQTPSSNAPTIVVSGAFNGGGSPTGNSQTSIENYEAQNYVYVVAGKHYLNFGVRARAFHENSLSTANFNGQYFFSGLTAYQITQQGLQNGLSAAQIRAVGGGASQFTIAAGNPTTIVTAQDVGLFFQDDWKLKPNLSLSFGLRYEEESHVSGQDWAPRFGFSWGFGGKPKAPPRYVLGGGAGIFYRRFPNTNIFTAAQQNGVNQQTYVDAAPSYYPTVPSISSLQTLTAPSIYQISPRLKADTAYVGQVNISKPITGKTTNGNFRLDALYAHGLQNNLIRNINAPLPGTYDPSNPASGVRPLGGTNNVYQYESGGTSYYFRFAPGVNIFSKRYSVYGYYSLVYAQTDTSGSFPSNGYDLRADRGRPSLSFDARNQLYLGGSTNLPFGFTAYMSIDAHSGVPFNITLGQDLNGDSQYNDRPAFATDLSRPSVVATQFGTFDTNPIAGQKTIPIDYGHSPAFFDLMISLGREWHFGPPPATDAPATGQAAAAPGPAPKVPGRYLIRFSAAADNIVNHVNLAQPVGVLGSPLFGKSIATATGFGFAPSANRVVLLQMQFSF